MSRRVESVQRGGSSSGLTVEKRFISKSPFTSKTRFITFSHLSPKPVSDRIGRQTSLLLYTPATLQRFHKEAAHLKWKCFFSRQIRGLFSSPYVKLAPATDPSKQAIIQGLPLPQFPKRELWKKPIPDAPSITLLIESFTIRPYRTNMGNRCLIFMLLFFWTTNDTVAETYKVLQFWMMSIFWVDFCVSAFGLFGCTKNVVPSQSPFRDNSSLILSLKIVLICLLLIGLVTDGEI